MTFLRSERTKVLFSIVLGIIGGLVGISIFGLSGYMISLSFFNPPLFTIILIIVVIKLFGMVKGVFKYFERLYSHEATFELINRLRMKYFKSSIHSETGKNHEWFVSRLNTHFETIEDFYIRIIYPFLTTVSIAVILVVLSFLINVKLVLIVALFSLIAIFLLPLLFQNKLKNLHDENRNMLNRLYMSMYHLIHGYTDLYVSGHLGNRKDDAVNQYADISKLEEKRMRIENLMILVAEVIQIVAIIFIITTLEQTHALYLPMILLLFLNFAEIVFPILRPTAEYKNVKASLQVIEEPTEETPLYTKEIVLENYSFRYEGSKRNALYGVNLEVRPREKHVIIGPSGSGKTTLLNQLLKTKSASVMPQFLDFYNASIYDNVTMFGHNEVPKEDVNTLLNAFELDNVESDTEIYYTHHMSTGEQKRLQIIRMLLEEKYIWILDEPTAGLSHTLRDKVWETLLAEDTVIVATHDLSHLKAFDYIHYIENGKIIETCTFQEAMKQKTKIYDAYQNFHELIGTLE